MIALARWAATVALLACISVASVHVHASTLRGEVVAIADGDTITVLDEGRVQHKVRLAGIDAPEKRQPFGTQSKDTLATAVFRRQVVVEWTKHDRYGRIVGKVSVGNVDVCLEQVKRGMAWHYRRYASEQSAEDRRLYAAAEVDSRRARRGLWRDATPTAPWDYRRR